MSIFSVEKKLIEEPGDVGYLVLEKLSLQEKSVSIGRLRTT